MFGFTGDEVTLFRCLGEVGSWSWVGLGWGCSLFNINTSSLLHCFNQNLAGASKHFFKYLPLPG